MNLAKPGRDPREPFEHFAFDENVSTMQDLRAGHEASRHRYQRHQLRRLRGHRRSPGRSGAHQRTVPTDSSRRRRTWSSVQQKVRVTVMAVDLPRNRISLVHEKPAGPYPPAEGPRSRGSQRKTSPAAVAATSRLASPETGRVPNPSTTPLPMPSARRRNDRSPSMIAVAQRVTREQRHR